MGVSQDSALGPRLWNTIYSGLLAFPAPEGTTIIAFAPHLAVVITAKYAEDVGIYGTETTVSAIKSCLEKSGLTLADEKMYRCGLDDSPNFPRCGGILEDPGGM